MPPVKAAGPVQQESPLVEAPPDQQTAPEVQRAQEAAAQPKKRVVPFKAMPRVRSLTARPLLQEGSLAEGQTRSLAPAG